MVLLLPVSSFLIRCFFAWFSLSSHTPHTVSSFYGFILYAWTNWSRLWFSYAWHRRSRARCSLLWNAHHLFIDIYPLAGYSSFRINIWQMRKCARPDVGKWAEAYAESWWCVQSSVAKTPPGTAHVPTVLARRELVASQWLRPLWRRLSRTVRSEDEKPPV